MSDQPDLPTHLNTYLAPYKQCLREYFGQQIDAHDAPLALRVNDGTRYGISLKTADAKGAAALYAMQQKFTRLFCTAKNQHKVKFYPAQQGAAAELVVWGHPRDLCEKLERAGEIPASTVRKR